VPQEYYATGHRKNAIAKVWLQTGEGRIVVNGKGLKDYVCTDALELFVRTPFEVISRPSDLDIRAQCLGGGIVGQAGALRHGIAKALVLMDETLRPTLRRAGLLTRDSRIKERKKYGRKRARRGFQFKKR
jgi:small subunit ribosomal protein S9